MILTILSIILLALAIACYSISQLQQHGKLKWSQRSSPFSFWGKDSHVRKYKELSREKGEAFFLSTTLLVSMTDGYHHMQFWMFNFLALSFTVAIGFNWWLLLAMLIGVRLIHGLAYKLLSR